MAFSALGSSKMRSLLTMLGIIIGITSVIVTVSLGEGIKRQITSQINQFGPDLISIRPGHLVKRDQSGKVVSYNLFSATVGTSSLSEEDLKTVEKTTGVAETVPLSLVTGVAEANDGKTFSGYVIGTTEGLPKMLNQKVAYGGFFSGADTSRNVAVIGKTVAEDLFGENIPIGKIFKVRGQEFIVRGIFEEFAGAPLAVNADFNTAIFVPYGIGKNISGGSSQIYQILAKPASGVSIDTLTSRLSENLRSNHGGQEDFTVLKQEENLAIAGSLLDIVTSFVAGIAAISLIVGGIGITNIMLVSVTERTREIGIRKSVGATNRQILNQFLTEACVLTIMGGVLGVLLSMAINFSLRIFTNLTPVITLPVVLIAAGVSMAVGIIFGIVPAAKAARKDPIQALRYE
jgi:ABC-type antimicrobial peptide transport system permease subunit